MVARPKSVEHPAPPPPNPEQTREAMRKVLKLDESLAEQRKVWRFYVEQSGDDVGKWRNLATQARQAVRFGGDKQAWRYTMMAVIAPTEEILSGIHQMAEEDGVYNPDLEEAIYDRIEQLVDDAIPDELMGDDFPTPSEMIEAGLL